MFVSRRKFLIGSAAVAAARAVRAQPSGSGRLFPLGVRALPSPAPGVPDLLAGRVDPVTVKQLALMALDVARGVGVTYADVRLTRTVGGGDGMTADDESLAVGVRCLVNGYWGFASSPYWRREEMPALARTAAEQAKANAKYGTARPIEWAPVPVASGDWIMPVEIDPFTVPLEEKRDYFAAMEAYLQEYRAFDRPDKITFSGKVGGGVSWLRQERAVATTDGAYFTQLVYNTASEGGIERQLPDRKAVVPFRNLAPGGRGYELFRDAKLLEQLPAMVVELDEYALLPVKPFDLGRYDVVVDAATMASLVNETLARATELDRALGYEANASGTSYLGPDPLDLVGTFRVGSPALTLAADRSMPGGLATVRWDEEGVVPEPATLVTDGVLTDFQTTREQASWLAAYYRKAGMPVRSHGHAGSQSALYTTMQLTPNLTMRPSAEETTLADLVSQTKKGLLLVRGWARADFQAKTGSVRGWWHREIVDGKLGALIGGGQGMFNSIELWNGLTAVGGPATAETFDMKYHKGQPEQRADYSLRAVAGAFKGVPFIRE